MILIARGGGRGSQVGGRRGDAVDLDVAVDAELLHPGLGPAAEVADRLRTCVVED
jgi:hypothetical protein